MTEELLDLEDSLLLDGDDDRFLLLILFNEDDKELLLFLANSANSAGANDSTIAFRVLLSDTEDNSEDSRSFFASLSLLLDLCKREGLLLRGLTRRALRGGERLLLL